MRRFARHCAALAGSLTLSGCITITGPLPIPSLTPQRPAPSRPPEVAGTPDPEVPVAPRETARPVVKPPARTPTPRISPRPQTQTCFETVPRATLPGGPQHGRYQGQLLPIGYRSFPSEDAVTAAFSREENGPNWVCFQRFYAGAVAVYTQLRQAPVVGPSAFAPPSAPPPLGGTVIVSGAVYDEREVALDGATVLIRSLDAGVAYSQMVSTVEGSFVVNDVPEGINVEVVAMRDGWTTRRRVMAFTRDQWSAKNLVNFGGPPDEYGDASGAAYFLSDHPEIVATSPEQDGRGVDPSQVSYRVTLSEPLDEDSRAAFEEAFAIVPADKASSRDAAGRPAPFTDILETEWYGGNLGGITASRFPYALRVGSTFLTSNTRRCQATWSAEGTDVTFTLDVGLQTRNYEAARYQAVLFTPGSPIEDNQGNMLGTDEDGNFRRPAVGSLLHNVFRDLDLAFDGNLATAWAQTHLSASRFEVAPDEVDPKLVGVGVYNEGTDTRLEATFSEPMAAFAGSGQALIDGTVLDLSNYALMLGRQPGDLAKEELDGPFVSLPGGPLATIKAALKPLAQFWFWPISGLSYTLVRGGNLRANPNALVAVEVSPDDPRTVMIWFRNGARDRLFEGYREIKARVAGVRDPAGNRIGGVDADRNQVTGSI